MSLSITDPAGLLSDELRQRLERRFLFALTRYDSRIVRTEVVVDSNENATGNTANQCLVHVELTRALPVSVVESNPDLSQPKSKS